MRAQSRLAILFLVAVGCGSSGAEAPPAGGVEPPPPPPQTAGGPEAPSAAPSAAAEPAKETPPPAPKPKSAATIAGVSVSEIDGAGLQKQLKKLGWLEPNTSVGGMDLGGYQNIRTDIKKGKEKGYVEIIKPATAPTASGTNMVPPKEQKDSRDKEGAATFYDDAADVLVIVSIEGKPADAKKLLGTLVKAK